MLKINLIKLFEEKKKKMKKNYKKKISIMI